MSILGKRPRKIGKGAVIPGIGDLEGCAHLAMNFMRNRILMPTKPMKQSAICGCMLDFSQEEIMRHMQEAEVDLLEWRLDIHIRQHSIEDALQAFSLFSRQHRLPFLVTNRPVREGGAFDGGERLRIEVLQRAVEAGAEWVDLEPDVPESELNWFRMKNVGIVLSHHEMKGTPPTGELQERVAAMARLKPDVIKMATIAKEQEDNLRVLGLIPWAEKELGVKVIAFCMGELGRWSRIACVAMGSPWTYVQMPGQTQAAPGQLLARDMRLILKAMGILKA